MSYSKSSLFNPETRVQLEEIIHHRIPHSNTHWIPSTKSLSVNLPHIGSIDIEVGQEPLVYVSSLVSIKHQDDINDCLTTVKRAVGDWIERQ